MSILLNFDTNLNYMLITFKSKSALVRKMQYEFILINNAIQTLILIFL
jgi:hypothetical protein